VDANAYKPHLEATASAALGMEVRIDGRPGIGFFPGLLLTLRDVHILNRERISSRQRLPELRLISPGSGDDEPAWLTFLGHTKDIRTVAYSEHQSP